MKAEGIARQVERTENYSIFHFILDLIFSDLRPLLHAPVDTASRAGTYAEPVIAGFPVRFVRRLSYLTESDRKKGELSSSLPSLLDGTLPSREGREKIGGAHSLASPVRTRSIECRYALSPARTEA